MHYNDIENAYTNHQYPDAECMLTDTNNVPDSMFTPEGVKLIPKKVTENGTYYASQDGANGYDEVVVDVEGHAEPVLRHLVCSHNGTFLPEEGVDGFDVVTTNVHPANPYVGNFTENQIIHVDGEYNGVDITVDVDAITNELTVTENGTYTPEAGVDGFSEVVVNVPQTYVGNTLKYLCYASFTGEDPATSNYNYPLDIKSYGGYDDYLTYNNNTNEIVVKKDFTAVIMLWGVNYAVGSYPAIMGLKLNGNWFISPIRTTSNNVDSVGTINTSFKSLDSQTSASETYIPDKSNCILIPLHVGDSLSIQKPFDHGWIHAYMKIYKLFDSTTSTDNFMNSVITTSDTSNYVNVNAGGSLTFDTLTATQNGQYTPTHDGYSSVTVAVPPYPNPYNATNLLVADEGGQYITNNLELALVAGKVYIGELNDITSGDLVPFIIKRDTNTSQSIILSLGNDVATLTLTNTTASLSSYGGSYRKIYLRLSEVVEGQLF